MIGVLALVALAMVVGLPFVARLGEERSRSSMIGLAFLFGTGAISCLMFVLSFLPGGWTRGGLISGCAIIGAIPFLAARRPSSWEHPARLRASGLLAIAAIIVTGHGMFATTAPLAEGDFIANWGLKAKLFWSSGSIDWRWLQEADRFQNHPDYPLLVPLLFDAVAVLNGGWDDRWIGLLYTGWGAALLLVAEARLRSETGGSAIAALATLVLTPLALTPWLGLGEGPLIAYGGAAVLLIRDACRRPDPRLLNLGAILLGFAALTKNEGVALILAVAVGMLAAGFGRSILHLVPAAVIALSWQIPRALLGLSNDLVEGNAAQRFAAGILRLPELLSVLAGYSWGRPLFWTGLVVGILVTTRRLFREERLVVVVVGVQLLVYMSAYLVSPHDVEWHVRWSWERLQTHLTFLLTFATLSAMLTSLPARGETISPDAPEKHS